MKAFSFSRSLLTVVLAWSCIGAQPDVKPPSVDLVCFSYDRPLQLRAFLESVHKRVKNLGNIFVLYRTSTDAFRSAYEKVKPLYPRVAFTKQGSDAEKNFKSNLVSLMFQQSRSDYIMFGVDDIVVTEAVDVAACACAMERYGAYGFYLRLGANITRCYTLTIERDFTPPVLTRVEPGMYRWQFKDGQYDWNYPHSMDMVIYRKNDVRDFFAKAAYKTPNSLDVAWDAAADRNGFGLCYEHSAMINIPLNIVQEDKRDRNMAMFSTEELLEECNQGFKINVEALSHFQNKAPHVHCIPEFVPDDERVKTPEIHKKAINPKLYFSTAADENFFMWLLQLIGSIHKTNFDCLEDIAVFDLGFTEEQRKVLRGIQKVHVCQLEMTNPDLTKLFKTNSSGKMVRGWYAWKPVILKQSLERFPYVLYVDAGCTILRPLNDLFAYIQEHNYFLIQDQVWCIGGKNVQLRIGDQATSYVIQKFGLNQPERSWILNKPHVIAGVQGLSRAMLDQYVLPMYELTKDLRNFQEDGTCPLGFGWARHDQTLFSIHAQLLNLHLIMPHQDVPLEADGRTSIVHVGDAVADKPHIFYNCKGQLTFTDDIRWR